MNFPIFRVGVSAAEEFFDIDMGYDVEIQNGYINIIKMYPSVMKMDPELKTKMKRSVTGTSEYNNVLPPPRNGETLNISSPGLG